MTNSLADFGWTDANQQAWDDMHITGARPARVVADFGTSLKIATPKIITAELSGKLAHYTDRDDTPKVGDWVSVAISDNNNATIESVVLRSNEIARKVTGKRTLKQIIAANVDIAFVLLALDNDFSVERLKRFLYQLSVSSIEPVIVLNKADKTDDVQSYVVQLKSLDLPIVVTIATEGSGVEDIAMRITPGKTAILLGSSGVGKSTLTNKLLGRNAQSTNTVRESDATGKHTTVHRELFILPSGGILIDIPGIRELQLWGTEEELDANYDDIAELAAKCRYANCRHTGELGCAIEAALANGTLDAKHYANYVKMKHELAELTAKNTEKLRQSKKRTSRFNRDRLSGSYDLSEGEE
jgi:ribosome biogenesis GTPase